LALTRPYIQRKVGIQLLDNQLIKVVIGPRRAGKSLFAQHLALEWGSPGYINFDDETLVSLKNYDEITAEITSAYNSPVHFLFDEIQNLQKWELWVNRLQRQGLKIILTGSNGHLLSSELSTHLTGRYEQIILFPFSFHEYRNAYCMTAPHLMLIQQHYYPVI